jgi:hypothetical protein
VHDTALFLQLLGRFRVAGVMWNALACTGDRCPADPALAAIAVWALSAIASFDFLDFTSTVTTRMKPTCELFDEGIQFWFRNHSEMTDYCVKDRGVFE